MFLESMTGASAASEAAMITPCPTRHRSGRADQVILINGINLSVCPQNSFLDPLPMCATISRSHRCLATSRTLGWI